ncbi:MAG TPA: outer membrane lipoprotein-sorting protein [Bacteroidales bacterium]|nr:outer membrane lipoprotein-sorting protein [Bacteroidales bacterium]HPT21643.1 outer membrane lipoprotein-sorting protein [Bacteroidales bacterium]
MKQLQIVTTMIFFSVINILNLPAQALSAAEIIKKADENFNGEKSSYTIMSMTIVRPSWQRSIEFRNWTLGRDYALTLITAPAKDVGQTFLKRKQEMWSWNPSISRLIKLPPSMLSQGWMGSDYTNDDILKESSVVNDYTHEIIGEETIGERLCYKIKMIAKEDAAVVWGHQIRWVDKKDLLFIKSELYDEDGYLVRTEICSDIKEMDGRIIPCRLELLPAEEKGNKTIVEIKEIRFNISISESYFSQQNMKAIR